MRKRQLLSFALLGAVAITAGCDWVETSTHKSSDKSTVSVTFNQAEFERDRAEYQRRAREQIAQFDAKLQDLNAQAKVAAGDAKQSLDVEVAKQQANLEKARGELKEIDAATAEKWADVKARSGAAFEDLRKGMEDALSRFK